MSFFKREAKLNVLYWIAPLLIVFVLWIYTKEFSPKRHNNLTKIRLKMIEEVLYDFKKDVGRFPTNDEGLQILLGKNKEGGGRSYISDEILADAWGNAFAYRKSDGIICISSKGKNKTVEITPNDVNAKRSKGDDIAIFIEESNVQEKNKGVMP